MNRRALALAVLCGVLATVTVGGWTGGLAGAGAAVVAYVWSRDRPGPAERAERQRVDADLPFAADLLAAALRAGAPPDVAARCAGHALGGPLGQRLLRVERALRLGASGEEAWSYLREGGPPESTATGGSAVGIRTSGRVRRVRPLAAGPEPAARLIRAAVRSQHSGAALAGALLRVADDLRADRLIAADADGRRAGVLIVLPLGLCFLPAFVLAGLVPVIVAVLGGVLTNP